MSASGVPDASNCFAAFATALMLREVGDDAPLIGDGRCGQAAGNEGLRSVQIDLGVERAERSVKRGGIHVERGGIRVERGELSVERGDRFLCQARDVANDIARLAKKRRRQRTRRRISRVAKYTKKESADARFM